MNKCDFCPYGENENGKIVCPFLHCMLDYSEIIEILKLIK